MLLLKCPTHDAATNLAIEEYLLHREQGDYLLVYSSAAALVVGKHQNAMAEANIPWVTRHAIPVIRRISGGGTVFHGPGNVNFSVIRGAVPGKQIDFEAHTRPVIRFLENMGVSARFSGKNDIRVGGLKISGNAAHVYKDRVLHHGTLLYDADLEMLRCSINAHPGRYEDKSVQSVRSRVTNLSSLIVSPPPFGRFIDMLSDALSQHYGASGPVSLSTDQQTAVQTLVAERYGRWEWNFGYAPPYVFTGEVRSGNGLLRCHLHVRDGVIESAHISGSGATNTWELLEGRLPGTRHAVDPIFKLLRSSGIADEADTEFPSGLYGLFF